MKIRNGFVSNSSSSSFIVVANGEHQEFPIDGEFTPGTGKFYSCTEFGWQRQNYYEFLEKVNFSYLINRGFNDGFVSKLRLIMLEEVIKEKTGCDSIDWSELDLGYIDHQSVEVENLAMFTDKETLETFLFSNESYISNGNDN